MIIIIFFKENEEETLKNKGVNLKDSLIIHDNYIDIYETGGSMTVDQVRFGTQNHQLYTIKSKKLALKCFDDKR